jgi:16S rRNA (guanine527-N7)-methyltransferase
MKVNPLSFSMDVRGKLKIYDDLLKTWQKKFNLVGPSTLNNSWHRHFQDSAQLYSLLPRSQNDRVVYDIGTGAGFPGMVLAIMGRKDMVLCESNEKKCLFLEEVKKKTSSNVIIDNIRAELLPEKSATAVIARAVTSLEKLLIIASPLLSNNGICIFPKGINWKKELLFAEKRFHIEYELVKSITSKDSYIVIIKNIERINVRK